MLLKNPKSYSPSMIYERFDVDNDEATAEYEKDFDFFITYHMKAIYDEDDFFRASKHEWIHALIEWASDGEVTVDQEHWFLRNLGWVYGL